MLTVSWGMKNCGSMVQISKLTLAGAEGTWTYPEEWSCSSAEVAVSSFRDKNLSTLPWPGVIYAEHPPTTTTHIPSPVKSLRAQAQPTLAALCLPGCTCSLSIMQVPLPPRRLPSCPRLASPFCGLPWLYPACGTRSLSARGFNGKPFITRPNPDPAQRMSLR